MLGFIPCKRTDTLDQLSDCLDCRHDSPGGWGGDEGGDEDVRPQPDCMGTKLALPLYPRQIT